MAGLKRTDNKGRILKDGETQRKDGTYRFTYTDADGVRHDVYSKRLVPTDRLPPGCKDDLCLREKERKINRDLEDGIKAAVENKAPLNDLFELYMANKPELKDTTRSNYLYMYNKYVRNDIGKKKIASIKYSDVKAFYNKLSKKRASSQTQWKSFTPSFTLYLPWPSETTISVSIQPPVRWQKSKRATTGRNPSATH